MVLRHSAHVILLSLCAYGLLVVLGTDEGSTGILCQACPAGTFADRNKSACENCSSSGECETTDACTPCPLGYNASYNGSPQCEKCPNGTFANTTRTINCHPCALGHYAPFKGMTACNECQEGSYANSTGMAKCVPCAPGSYCNDTGCHVCPACEAGSATSAKGSTNCSICSLGSYAPSNSSMCLTCDNGTICKHLGCGSCHECPPGEQPHTSYDCKDCPAGTCRSANSSNPFCAKCQQGYYQMEPGKEECKECPTGFYCKNPSSNPQPCPDDARCDAGSYEPSYCQNLFRWNKKKTHCIPETDFYLMIGSLILFVILMAALVSCTVYWNTCRRRPLPEDKVPLTDSRSRSWKEPVYTGL